MMEEVYMLELTYEHPSKGETPMEIKWVEGIYKTRELAESRENYLLRKGTYAGCVITDTEIVDTMLVDKKYWEHL